MPRYKAQPKPKRCKVKGKRTSSTNQIDGGDRFLDLAKNPMFREQKKKDQKIVVDDRFKDMLSDTRFETHDSYMDKRGRPIRKAGKNYLARLYEVDDEEKQQTGGEEAFTSEEDQTDEESSDEGEEQDIEEEDTEDLPQIHLDLARGEGPDVTSSSEDEVEEDEFGEDEDELELDPLEDAEKKIQRVEWASSRLAICNMDWSKMTAEDLMLILQSFQPSSGSIHSVSVYLSDFGAQCLEEEKTTGPRLKLRSKEGSTKQAIRNYEFNRLRYYYAVCECDTVETATAIYEACDGTEYETSGLRFDLRFIPEDMQFEKNRLRDSIKSDELNLKHYKPKQRVKAHPLICSNPKMTWEDVDPERRNKMRQAFDQNAELNEFESLIAPCSDNDEEESQKTRYEMLIAAANEVKDEMDTIFKNNFQEKIEAEKGVETEELAANIGEEEFIEKEEDSEDEISDFEEDAGPRKKKTKFQAYLERKKQLKTERKQKDLDKRRAVKRKRPDQIVVKNTKIDSEDIIKQVEEDNRFAAFFVDSAFAIDMTHGEFGDLAKKQVYSKIERRKNENKKGFSETEVSQTASKRSKTSGKTEEEPTMSLVEKLKKKQKQRLAEGIIESG